MHHLWGTGGGGQHLAENEDNVTLLNGGKAVGDDDCSALTCVRGHHCINAFLQKANASRQTPRGCNAQVLACTIFSLVLSSALVASSSRLMVALRSSMRAIATRCL
jgi:hypothetical protein